MKKIFFIVLLFGLIIGDIVTGIIGMAASPTYSINFALKTSGINDAVVLPTAVGFNCTGITTSALTTISNKGILITGQYNAIDRNQTAYYEWVFVNIGTVAPSTVFGTGTCAATNSARTQLFLYFPVASATNIVSVSFSFTFVPTANTTYYGWIDIEQRNVVSGHIDYRNQGGSGQSSISLIELR